VDFAVAQLALIFMPGIIWAGIDARFGAGLKPDQIQLIIRSFLFGMATYSVLYIIYFYLGQDFGYSSIGAIPEHFDLFQFKDEIAWSIPLSFLLSICWLWSVRFKLLVKVLHKIGASRRYGDEDVWSYTFNSSQPYVEYVHVRDIENGFVFAGWVNTYSEGEDNRELLLRDVIVYNDESVEVSQAPYLYICRPRASIWLEFPYKAGVEQNV
jgi:hypothetical protein